MLKTEDTDLRVMCSRKRVICMQVSHTVFRKSFEIDQQRFLYDLSARNFLQRNTATGFNKISSTEKTSS